MGAGIKGAVDLKNGILPDHAQALIPFVGGRGAFDHDPDKLWIAPIVSGGQGLGEMQLDGVFNAGRDLGFGINHIHGLAGN